MRKIKWELNTGFCGRKYAGEFEVDDGVSDEIVEELVRDYAYDYLDLSWEDKAENGRLTRAQKILLTKYRLNPDNWLYERETPDKLVLVHRYTGAVRVIDKG